MKKPFLMSQTIVLDFDDTLVNTNLRQYLVIESFFDQYQIKIESFDNYIKFRLKTKASNTEFARKYINSFELLNEYKEYFSSQIESDDFLIKDDLIVDKNLLKTISSKYNIILLSLRTSCQQGIKQMAKLGLIDFFNEIYFLKHQVINPKIEVLKKLKEKTQILAFVGDTTSDYDAANQSQTNFIGVNTGLFPLPTKLATFENINTYLQTLIEHNDKIQ